MAVEVKIEDCTSVPVVELPEGTFFMTNGELFLKIKTTRGQRRVGRETSGMPQEEGADCSDTALTVCIPNYDHSPDMKVSGAYVRVRDGEGRYFPDVCRVYPVENVEITGMIGDRKP